MSQFFVKKAFRRENDLSAEMSIKQQNDPFKNTVITGHIKSKPDFSPCFLNILMSQITWGKIGYTKCYYQMSRMSLDHKKRKHEQR